MLRTLLAVTLTSSLSLVTGCVITSSSESIDAEPIRKAMPSADEVKLDVTDAAGSTTKALEPGFEAQTDGSTSKSATFYRLTRGIFDHTNLGTGAILGGLKLIVQQPPTSKSDGEIVWGPWTESLHPAEWRLRVVEEAQGEYSYAWEGRRKDGGPTAVFVPVLSGKAYAEGHARHGTGSFTIDSDAATRLDPDRLGADDEGGTLVVTYDGRITVRDGRTLPEKISVSSKLSKRPDVWFDVVVTREASGGRVDLKAHDDLDEKKATKLEDIDMRSRWAGNGAGRADVKVTGGDLPSTVSQVTFAECWGTSFTRSYYTDSIGSEPTEGREADCPFGAATF